MLTPTQRLIVTLRYLATGASFMHLAHSFRLGCKTVSVVIKETCDLIYKYLQPMHLKFPNTPEEWLAISEDYFKKWQVPNCLGSNL